MREASVFPILDPVADDQPLSGIEVDTVT